MRNKYFLPCLLVILIFSTNLLQAQQSLNTTGNDVTGANGSISYSVGQVFYQTKTSDAMSMAEGVQQAYEIMVMDTNDVIDSDISLSIYPNPTHDILQITLNPFREDLHYKLYDVNGKILWDGLLNNAQTQIDMKHLPTSVYFIKLMKNNVHIKTFKVLKK